jgi:hypothetical protein
MIFKVRSFGQRQPNLRFALCRSRKLPRAQSYSAKDPQHRAFVDALASLRTVTMRGTATGACGLGSSLLAVDGGEGSRESVVRAVIADLDFWKSAALSPQEFDKVQ